MCYNNPNRRRRGERRRVGGRGRRKGPGGISDERGTNDDETCQGHLLQAGTQHRDRRGQCRQEISVQDLKGAVADAKSILGLMNLDFSQPVEICGDDPAEVEHVYNAVRH